VRTLLPVLAAAMLLPAAGCTHDQLYGFAYEEGRNYSCRQAAEHKPNESMEEFRCMTEPQARGGPSWEEYKEAREQELGVQAR
jgi:hypothetical protein